MKILINILIVFSIVIELILIGLFILSAISNVSEYIPILVLIIVFGVVIFQLFKIRKKLTDNNDSKSLKQKISDTVLEMKNELKSIGQPSINVNKQLEPESKTDSCYQLSNTNTLNWEISVSFGKSSSSNFNRAVFLAKKSDRYEEYDYDGQAVYQAYYSAEPKSYLKFIELYEMISKWKSVKVMINGEFVDRKIIGGLNYCYGDKCRSHRSDFCYGASYMTKNPFGCHRLQISACNNPWFTFSTLKGHYYIIDKQSIYNRAYEYSQPYLMCPCFDWNRVEEVINKLPDKLTIQQFNQACSDENFMIQEFIKL